LDRIAKFKLNTITSVLNRVVLIISGIILPRLVLLNYGSETNGLVASITQLYNSRFKKY